MTLAKTAQAQFKQTFLSQKSRFYFEYYFYYMNFFYHKNAYTISRF